MRRRAGQIRRIVRLGVLVAFAGAACSTPAPSPGTLPPTPSLECEAQGYPCSLGEVPPKILEQSDALGDQASQRLDEGGSTADLEIWLKTQPGLAEVEADDMAVRFRLEGGRGVWVLRKEALAQNVGDASASVAATANDVTPVNRRLTLDGGSFATPASAFALARVSLHHIVGGDTEQKHALVLSPMLHDFADTDDGAPVAAILESTRGYENGVTYLANPTIDSTNVGVESFRGWRDYQVIHVVSHGARVCKKSPCRAVIVARELPGTVASPEQPERALELEAIGGELCKAVGGRTFLCLDADFFRHEYPGGLVDTLVFFNACETYGSEATDLGDAIRGSTSVYLGWSEEVSSESARAAALKLYAELSGKGVPVGSAYDALDGSEDDPSGPAVLTVGKRQAGGDLRIRDVVWLRHPDTKEILSESDEVPIDGTEGDGENDAAPYLVQVDGLKPEEASGVLLHVSVDGEEAEPKPVSSGARDDDQWLVSGEFPLGYDLKGAKSVTFRAWIELPSGGESDEQTPATLTGRKPAWEGQANFVSGVASQGDLHTTATAELTFELMHGQEASAKHPIYVVTGGTMTWSRSGTDLSGCTYVAGPVTIPLNASNTALTIPSEGTMVGSFLMFDTTKTPVEYTGIVKPDVTEVTMTKTCPNPDDSDMYTDPTVAVFLRADSEAHWTVSGDTIAGSYHIDRQTPSGWYEVDWSFTRK